MAINPNTDFSSGAVLTAAQQNRFPRGIMAYAESSTSQNLSTTSTIATGMSVTFTAVVGRSYKVTYQEPEVQTPTLAAGNTICTIKLTDASTTALAVGVVQTPSAAKTANQIMTIAVVDFATAGIKTIVGACSTSSTTGTPALERTATRIAILMVEDIGLA